MATLLALRTKLRKRIGNPSLTDAPDIDLTEIMNEAYSDIAMKFKFHKARKLCQFNTIVNDPRYGIPADCYAVLRIRDTTNKRKLEKGGDRTAAMDITTTSGQPLTYVRQRDWVLFIPPPDGIYVMEMYYKAKPTDLVVDGDFPVTPAAWDEGILRLARYYYFDRVGDLPKAQFAQSAYDKWVAEMPLEFDDESEAIDSAIEIPTLSNNQDPRLDFDHGP